MKPNRCTKLFVPCSLLSLVVLLTVASPLSARILPSGFGIKTGIAGNGLRSAPTVTMNFTGQKWELELGADVQLKNTHLSGTQATVYYYPMRMNIHRMRIGFFANARYNFATLLSNTVILQEKFLQPEARMNMNEVMLQTAEISGGFLLRLQHGQHVSTFYGIGFGAYQTLGNREDYPLMHREFNHVQLVMQAGITVDLRKSY